MEKKVLRMQKCSIGRANSEHEHEQIETSFSTAPPVSSLQLRFSKIARSHCYDITPNYPRFTDLLISILPWPDITVIQQALKSSSLPPIRPSAPFPNRWPLQDDWQDENWEKYYSKHGEDPEWKSGTTFDDPFIEEERRDEGEDIAEEV